jgi:hypothetical protein
MRFRSRLWLLGLAAGLASACHNIEAPPEVASTDTADAQHFSLRCEGTSYFRSETVPFVQTLTVDLEAGRFCVTDCSATYRFADRRAGLLILQNEDYEGHRLDKVSWFPASGQYLAEFEASDRRPRQSHTIAICKRVASGGAMPPPPSVEPSRDPLRGPRGPLHFSPPTSPQPAP